MPWLLDFIDTIINGLLEDLNAQVPCNHDDEIECGKDEIKYARGITALESYKK